MNKRFAFPFFAMIASTAWLEAAAVDTDPGASWQFDVSLDGKPIGSHSFEIQRQGTETILTTEASFDVKFLFVTAFRYRHQNTEVWRDDCLLSIDASTVSNGKEQVVRGTAKEDSFKLQSAGSSNTLPSCIQTFAYWNPSMLASTRLLNSQTGVYEDVSVTLEGRDEVPVAGNPVEALRYRLSAQTGDITLWYSADDNTWLGLEAPAKGGRKLLYQAVSVPQALSQVVADNR
ncbi:MAG: hypothetical protein KJO09_06770 [Gammaproteobacteria bacterium]|nr:hypothetical protein [Gammaproteobacteria bacterium]